MDTGLQDVITQVRSLVKEGDLKGAEAEAAKAMAKWPHSPVPQNLMGLVLELDHDHLKGLAHFRAALALDPGYGPARRNLECFGAVFHGYCSFDDQDVQTMEKKHSMKVQVDPDGLARVVPAWSQQ